MRHREGPFPLIALGEDMGLSASCQNTTEGNAGWGEADFDESLSSASGAIAITREVEINLQTHIPLLEGRVVQIARKEK